MSLIITIVAFSLLLQVSLLSSNFKLCCDPECKEPISHGRTIVRNVRREPGYLTYPANSKLTIWAKYVGETEDVWEAEIQGRKGLINEKDVQETVIHCSVPKYWVSMNESNSESSSIEEVGTTDLPSEIPSLSTELNGVTTTFVPVESSYSHYQIPPNHQAETEAMLRSAMLSLGHTHLPSPVDEFSRIPDNVQKWRENQMNEEMRESDNLHDDHMINHQTDSNDNHMINQKPESHDNHMVNHQPDSHDDHIINHNPEVSEYDDDKFGNEKNDHLNVKGLPHESEERRDIHKPDESERPEERKEPIQEPQVYKALEPEESRHFNEESLPHESEERRDIHKPDESERPEERKEPIQEPHVYKALEPEESRHFNEESLPHESEERRDIHKPDESERPEERKEPIQEPHVYKALEPEESRHFNEENDKMSSQDEEEDEDEDEESSHFGRNGDSLNNGFTDNNVDKERMETLSNSQNRFESGEHGTETISDTVTLSSDTSLQADESMENTLLISKSETPVNNLDTPEHLSIVPQNFAQTSDLPHTENQTPHISEPHSHISEPHSHISEPRSHTSEPRSHISEPHPHSSIPNHIPHLSSLMNDRAKAKITDTPPNQVSPFQNSQSSIPPEEQMISQVTSSSSQCPNGICEDLGSETSIVPMIPSQNEKPWQKPTLPDTENPVRLSPTPKRMRPSMFSVEEALSTPFQPQGVLLDSILDICVSFLPSSLGEWLLALGPDAGLIGILATVVAMVLPLCCLCCRASRSASKSSKKLKSEQDHRRNIESHIKKLTEEKLKLETDSQNLRIELRGCQEELDNEKQGNWDLENARSSLENGKLSLTQALHSSQQEHIQTQSTVKQLTFELQQASSQLTAVIEEKGQTLQHATQLHSQLEQAVLKCQELEAVKEQLEQDSYEVRQNLQQLQQEHSKVCADQTSISEKCQHVETELFTVTNERNNLLETLTDKNREIQTLQDCVQQLSTVEGEEKSAQLDRVQSMLDTTKVQSTLRAITEDRDKLKLELQDEVSALDQLQHENESLQEQLSELSSGKEILKQEYQETELKLKAITEYFEKKESQLHRKIGEEEMVRQRVESREAHAQERAEYAEQEREKEREELKELRKQMGDIEKSLMQQVVTNEKRAEETLSQLRRTEQELRAANKEVTSLKRRLAEMEDMRRSNSPPGPRSSLRPIPPPELRRSPLHGPLRGPLHGPPPYGPMYGPRGSHPLLGGPRPPPGSIIRAPLHPRTSSPLEDTDKETIEDSRSDLPPRPRSTLSEDPRVNHQGEEGDVTRHSRPPPPGMESRDPYRPRLDYPPPHGDYRRPYGEYGRPIPPRRPLSRGAMSDRGDTSLDEGTTPHLDRPPIPGNPDLPPPARLVPPRDTYRGPPPPLERRRPPSGPIYNEMIRPPPLNPHLPPDYPPRQRMPFPAVKPLPMYSPHFPPHHSLPTDVTRVSSQNENQQLPISDHTNSNA